MPDLLAERERERYSYKYTYVNAHTYTSRRREVDVNQQKEKFVKQRTKIDNIRAQCTVFPKGGSKERNSVEKRERIGVNESKREKFGKPTIEVQPALCTNSR